MRSWSVKVDGIFDRGNHMHSHGLISSTTCHWRCNQIFNYRFYYILESSYISPHDLLFNFLRLFIEAPNWIKALVQNRNFIGWFIIGNALLRFSSVNLLIAFLAIAGRVLVQNNSIDDRIKAYSSLMSYLFKAWFYAFNHLHSLIVLASVMEIFVLINTLIIFSA